MDTREEVRSGAAHESASPAIVARGLTKRFGSMTAVDGLSFEVVPGRVTGFVGPNGAGKSTTLRMLLGLVEPDDGTATVLGIAVREPRAADAPPWARCWRSRASTRCGPGGTTCGCSRPRRGSTTRASTRCSTSST